MTSIIVGLVSFAFALCLGWVLSKAYFVAVAEPRHVEAAEYQRMRDRYRRRLKVMTKVVKRHETTQRQIKDKLIEIDKARRARSRAKPGDTQNEIAGLISDIDDQGRAIDELDSSGRNDGSPTPSIDPQAELDAVRAEVTSRERQVHQLREEVCELHAEQQELRATVDSWKQRVDPLARKVKEQRELIRELKGSADAPA